MFLFITCSSFSPILHSRVQVGFNFPILEHFLQVAGFCQIQRVQKFNVFSTSDTSELVYKGHFVSLNVVAKVCADNTPGGKQGVGRCTMNALCVFVMICD